MMDIWVFSILKLNDWTNTLNLYVQDFFYEYIFSHLEYMFRRIAWLYINFMCNFEINYQTFLTLVAPFYVSASGVWRVQFLSKPASCWCDQSLIWAVLEGSQCFQFAFPWWLIVLDVCIPSWRKFVQNFAIFNLVLLIIYILWVQMSYVMYTFANIFHEFMTFLPS